MNADYQDMEYKEEVSACIGENLRPNLIFQFGTSRWGGTRKLPFAFTENGVAMLSSILNSQRAIQVKEKG